MDRRRHLLRNLDRALREFPCVVVIGLRQIGKTTLVRQISRARAFVSLDDLGALEAAQRDPAGWLAALPRPVTIDEAQRVPELVLAIKREIDRRRRPGELLLTGSARIELRRGVRETLAGRAALLRLHPMTWAEAAGRPEHDPIALLLGCRSAAEAVARARSGRGFEAARVLRGGLPVPLLRARGSRGVRWLEQFRAAYVERDVPPLLRLDEVAPFLRFLALVASRTAQTTNHAAIAHEVGVSADTGLRWFGVLEATFLVDLVPPYFRNIGKRLVKSPKLHVGDAALAAHLAGVRSPGEAKRLGFAGALSETLVAQHLLAFAESSARPARLFHYRTHAGAEVDFVVARGARLLPVEVKAAATVRASELRGLRSFLDDHAKEAPFGVVLYGGTEPVALGRGIAGLPLGWFLEG